MADLDDPAELTARDGGRLLTIARAGASVRHIAAQRIDALRGADIGACGVVCSELLTPASGTALARLCTRLRAPIGVPLPVLDARAEFPRAADLVVIVSVNGLERRLLDSVHLAAARGAEVIVVAPESSPIAFAAAERHLTCATFEETDDITAWWSAVAAIAASFATAELATLPDVLDDAAAALGPVVQTYRNPAKQIALLDSPLLVVATDTSAALAGPLLVDELGARSTWSVRGIDVRFSFTELLGYADERSTGSVDDLFYDPQIDGPQTLAPARGLVLLSGARPTDPSAPDVAEEALRVAERIGAVRAVAFGDDEHWSDMALVLLAQLSGTYYTLAND
ncbi:MAG: hypothetical protein ACK5MR_03460 [Cumulibacter sp.]